MSLYTEKHIGQFSNALSLQTAQGEISARRLRLLSAIGQTGSIAAAAKHINMTYKAAWDAVDAMNNIAGTRLVSTRHGGAHGGGAVLTEAGTRLVAAQQRIDRLQRELTQVLEQNELVNEMELLRKMNIKTSARNAFSGQVSAVDHGAVNTEVQLTLPGGDILTAIITRQSADELNLAVGQSAYALIKSSFVLLADPASRTSARNHLCGRIERIETGAVNSEVVVALSGGTRITAIVTNDSVQTLGLRIDGESCAQIKASHVIIGVAE